MRDAMFAVLPFIGTMEEATAVFDFCRDKGKRLLTSILSQC